MKDVSKMYTTLSEAKKELEKRWNDKELKKKIENFLGEDLPEIFKEKPRAYLVRDIISPNFEFFYFLDLVKEARLDIGLCEYSGGKLVAKNFNKYHLCRMFFHNGMGKKNGDKIDTFNVIDFNKSEGKTMNKVKTIWGNKLIDFHHKLLKKITKVNPEKIFDITSWFNAHRNKTEYYYLHYLALFLAHGILFENFLFSKGEEEFTRKKIIPSFKKLEKIFGIKPLVVPATLLEDESEAYWWYYPNSIKQCFKIETNK
jgi:hypothetical protein